VFVGSDVTLVTLCAFTVLPFALPMPSKSALLPYLPDDDKFLPFLESRVPFCFEVLNSDRPQAVSIGPDVTVIDLDGANVSYPEDIPHLPGAAALRAELKELLQCPSLRVPKRADQIAGYWRTRDYPEMKKRLALRYCFMPDEARQILAASPDLSKSSSARKRYAAAE
jgi:hypothetical protein